MITRAKLKIRSEANKLVKRFGIDVYKQQQLTTPLKDDIECWFESSDGRKIPILKKHRYNLKKSWTMFGPIAALEGLSQRKLLSEKDKKILERVKGHRTITMPLPEVRSVLQPYLEKYENLFVNTDIPDLGSRVFMPTATDTEAIITSRARQHKKLLSKLENISGGNFSQKSKVLEIGYTSGGESIIAFERLGIQAIGLDYFYDDNFETGQRHKIVKELAKSKSQFLIGDITKKNDIDDESIDLIFTQSVLEHIKNLPSAFNEMYRLLKPGGIMYHRYDPYFHIKGGHPPCMLDSPWAHVQLNAEDIHRYIKELRPHEAAATIPWIDNSLNREHNQRFVQNALIHAGFSLHEWQNIFVSAEQQSTLTPEIISNSMKITPNISLDDLLSYAVTFIAVKPKD